ncbi:hypothetical protein CUMW_121120 [Citrus unshiu]|nr:hypothetical protein CUMW_121120 [Citrus unshiu]
MSPKELLIGVGTASLGFWLIILYISFDSLNLDKKRGQMLHQIDKAYTKKTFKWDLIPVMFGIRQGGGQTPMYVLYPCIIA